MKKIVILVSISVASVVAHADAQLTKINSTTFKDQQGNLISYPCSHGGSPLVVYGDDTVGNNANTMTKPIYVEPGFSASDLAVSNLSSVNTSGKLNINAMSPASQTPNIVLDLTTLDGHQFYVNTVNFSGPTFPTETSNANLYSYVATEAIYLNDELAFTTFAPIKQVWFGSNGTDIQQNISSITFGNSIWNEHAKWYQSNDGGIRYSYPMSYNMRPQLNDANIYNGAGFWICGSSSVQQKLTKSKNAKFNTYNDLIKSSTSNLAKSINAGVGIIPFKG